MGMVSAFRKSPTRDFPGDLFMSVMLTLVGGVCLYVALRWCRAVRGIFEGKAVDDNRSVAPNQGARSDKGSGSH
jgi:hypothetical protein